MLSDLKWELVKNACQLQQGWPKEALQKNNT